MAVLNQAFVPYCARDKQKKVTLKWNKWPNSYSNKTCSSLILVKTWLAVGTCPRNCIRGRLVKHVLNYRSVPRQPVNLLAVEYEIYRHFLFSRSITVPAHVNPWLRRDRKVYDKKSVESLRKPYRGSFPRMYISQGGFPKCVFWFLDARFPKFVRLLASAFFSITISVIEYCRVFLLLIGDFFRNPLFPALEIYWEIEIATGYRVSRLLFPLI